MPNLSGYRLGLLLTTISAIAWSTTGLFTRIIPLDSASTLVSGGVVFSAVTWHLLRSARKIRPV